MVAPIIGLTGGIGAGKSTVAAFLTELGARVIDADRIGHEVYRPGSEGFARVAEAFGPGVVGADGAIDRRALGALVFADPAARARPYGRRWRRYGARSSGDPRAGARRGWERPRGRSLRRGSGPDGPRAGGGGGRARGRGGGRRLGCDGGQPPGRRRGGAGERY